MRLKNITFIIISFIFIYSCADYKTKESNIKKEKHYYSSNGFALILPDGKPETPTFLVFDNYEKILKWNRSLRFGISVCTLAEMIKA